MGSVCGQSTCPNCETENLWYDFDYRRDELWEHCQLCGFYHNEYWKRNDQGELILKSENEGTTFDNLIKVVEGCRNPYGTYEILSENGGSQFGTFETEEEFVEFSRQMKNRTDNTKIIVQRYVNKLVKRIVI